MLSPDQVVQRYGADQRPGTMQMHLTIISRRKPRQMMGKGKISTE
jgi:hypothetical protein